MKIVFALFALLSVLSAAAPHAYGENAKFEARKAEMLKHLDEKSQKFNEHKTCITNAKDSESLKKCRTAIREWARNERAQHLEKHKNKLDERLNKLRK